MALKSLRITTALSTVTAAVILTSCGGGGGNSSSPNVSAPPPTPPTSTVPTYTQGVFRPEGEFKNKCETPRTEPSAITGEPYPDLAGSTLEENFWLRSWSNNTYLWYDEITDVDPNVDNDPLVYFSKMKTFAKTASGKDKDEFQFTQDTAAFERARSGGASVSYGAQYRFISTSPPRKLIIAFTIPDSVAATSEGNQLFRGTEILEIDGVDVINGSDVTTLNNGLFPSTAGETHEFKVRDIGATDTRTITLAAEAVTPVPVNTTNVITAQNGDKVGYVHLTTFGSVITQDALFDAMTEMKDAGINDLVLDLRYNGGGLLAIAGQLGYMIAGDAQTEGKIFDRIVFNDKHPNINPVTGNQLQPVPFYKTTLRFSDDSPATKPLPTVAVPRLFLLSTSNTCSASESIINGLRGIDVEVILIGGRTCGKPYGFYSTDNCGTTYSNIQIGAENDKGFGEYADGFLPENSSEPFGVKIKGCELEDDFTKALGDETETLLSAALTYQQTGSCPATPKPSAQLQAKVSTSSVLNPDPALDLMSDPRIKAKFMMEQNAFLDARIYRHRHRQGEQ